MNIRIETGWMRVDDAYSKQEQRRRRRNKRLRDKDKEEVFRRPHDEKLTIDLVA